MKVAVSIPDDVFEAGESLATQLGIPRSQLYAEALASYLSQRQGVAVTRRLNEVYARQPTELDPALAAAQWLRVADEAW